MASQQILFLEKSVADFSNDNATLATNYNEISLRNIYAICWRGTAADNLKYSKQMGYHQIQYIDGMENLPDATGIRFMLQKPDNLLTKDLGVKQVIQYGSTYTADKINIIQSYFCIKNTTKPFPHNIANGWFTFNNSGVPTTFAVVHDWQQKRVVDRAVELTVAEAKKLERPEKGFIFGGLAWDEPDLVGDFSNDSAAFKKGTNVAVGLSFWTGSNKSIVQPGTTHEYSTHSDGKAAYYKILKSKFKVEFPGRKMIYHWEPYKLNGELLHDVLTRTDKIELMEDVFWTSEGEGKQITMFADDATLFEPGKLKRDWVGSTQPNEHSFDKIKEIVGKAGIHGSWFGWFGRFNAVGINNIYEIPNWHQLARSIPSWDNLCGVPLSQRSFVNGVYLSSNSSMSDKVLYSRQHETNKLFVVFMDPTATIPLKPGDKVLSVKRVNNFFMETTEASSQLNITNKNISLSTTSSLDIKINSFSISPNPTKDYLLLKMDIVQKEYSYQIIDLIGRQLKTDVIKESDTYISVDNLDTGTYFIQLKNGSNLLNSMKFIKK
jgi:hypothetical protein